MKSCFIVLLVALLMGCNPNWGKFGGYRLEYDSALDYYIVLDKGESIYASDSDSEARRKGIIVKFFRPSGIIDSVLVGRDGYIIESFVDKHNLVYNDRFILIDQKPINKLCLTDNYSECEIALEKAILHYYWIIDKKQDNVYGPFNKNQFLSKRKELKVPPSLKINL